MRSNLDPATQARLDAINAAHETDYYVHVDAADAAQLLSGVVPIAVQRMAYALLRWNGDTMPPEPLAETRDAEALERQRRRDELARLDRADGLVYSLQLTEAQTRELLIGRVPPAVRSMAQAMLAWREEPVTLRRKRAKP